MEAAVSGSLAAPAITLPLAYEAALYRAANPDLATFADADLERHYRTYGEHEGRLAHAIETRERFAALVPDTADTLEIGPYYSPLLRGPKTKYFDVLTRDAMLARADSEGFDGSGAPEIDFVSPTGDLAVVEARRRDGFDVVFSSHAIEHQPDLVSHLRAVERLLRPGGRYFAIVPDKRYCFDHFTPESIVTEMLEAYHERRTLHTFKNVLNMSVMTTHNDCARHWRGDHGTLLQDFAGRLRSGLEDYETAAGGYLDVHAWYFTPASTRAALDALRMAGYLTFEVERLYPTLRDTFEFWMVLRKPEAVG